MDVAAARAFVEMTSAAHGGRRAGVFTRGTPSQGDAPPLYEFSNRIQPGGVWLFAALSDLVQHSRDLECGRV